MSSSLQSTISGQLGWTWRDRVDVAPIVDSNRLSFQLSLCDGNGPGQCNSVWHLEDQMLLAGQSAIYYLDALPQVLFGASIAIALAAVKALLIVNRAEAGHIVVGGAASLEWHAPFGSPGDTARVMPHSPWLAANSQAGWPVTAGSSALKIAAAESDTVYDIAILGTRVE